MLSTAVAGHLFIAVSPLSIATEELLAGCCLLAALLLLLASRKRRKNRADTRTTNPDQVSGRQSNPLFTQPHVRIAAIGHAGHGKSTVTSAMTRLLNLPKGRQSTCHHEFHTTPEQRARGITVSTAYVQYGTGSREYFHADCPGHADYTREVLRTLTGQDGVILVVSAADGPMPQTREHLLLARHAGVSYVVVYLNKVDLVDDPEMIVMVEQEIRRLLQEYGFPGEEIPIVAGSAARAKEGDSSELGQPSIRKLVDALDRTIPLPTRNLNRPFLMPIDDTLVVSGKGPVVTGRIERGEIKHGDAVEVVGLRPESRVTPLTAIENLWGSWEQVRAGDYTGLLLRGLNGSDLERGMVVSQPGTIRAYNQFHAEVYLLREDEGGPGRPTLSGFRAQFFFRTAEITGELNLLDGVEMALPGETLLMKISLQQTVALEDGLRFVIRDRRRTVGTGVVVGLEPQQS